MDVISNIPDCGSKKRIVIIGGGFAGLQFTKSISPDDYQIVLIDKVNFHQFQPLFYQVASGGLEPSSISYPHRKTFQKKHNFHFRMCKALSVKADEKIVETSIGQLKYDYLIIAAGCDTNYFGNDKLRENTFGLKSTAESLLARNRILLSFEESLNAKNETELKEILSFVIVGGGATGVELAGALADMRKSILPKDYPEMDFSKMEIHLVDASPRLLSGMSPEASKSAADTLSKRGVILHQDVLVNDYDYPCVELSSGLKIRSRNVFWVGGIKPNIIEGFPQDTYFKGRMLVDNFTRVKGCEDIFCIGDTAMLKTEQYPNGHPQVAQVAIQMARNLAKNLNSIAKGNGDCCEFQYKDKGSLATIGRNAAVADLGKFKFKGRLAWWLWLWVHLMSIVGMKNKVLVLLDWIWSYLNYDVSLRLFIKPKFNSMYERLGREK